MMEAIHDLVSNSRWVDLTTCETNDCGRCGVATLDKTRNRHVAQPNKFLLQAGPGGVISYLKE